MGGTGKEGRVVCLLVCFSSTVCLVLRRKPGDIGEILPCSFISKSLIISEAEGRDSRRILEVFKLDHPASHESDLLFSDI